MNSVRTIKEENVPLVPLCKALDLSRATVYRHLKVVDEPSSSPFEPEATQSRKPHSRALSNSERRQVMELLHGERFQDKSPAHVVATLLDEGQYLCSERTMYRLLEAQGESKERRAFVQHGNYKKPELLATAPNQVWSWDITKLHGPEKWNYFYLYVIMDIFSRYVVGWMIADREWGLFAETLIRESLNKQNIIDGQLTIHSDRGGPMKSKPVGFLLADLGVTKSFSRPQVSNDNPFSEAQFKTLKYMPNFPERFGCKEDANFFCKSFFKWYNQEHKHSGIGYYSPEDLHYGRAKELQRIRNETLAEAYKKNPERFVRKPPSAPRLPTEVWINPPTEKGGHTNIDQKTL
jgi:putative transposase